MLEIWAFVCKCDKNVITFFPKFIVTIVKGTWSLKDICVRHSLHVTIIPFNHCIMLTVFTQVTTEH